MYNDSSRSLCPRSSYKQELMLTCLLGQQEKRFRSMQEHIRRAHPDYYISKLPATEESFLMMVNTPLDQRPQQPPPPQNFGTPSAYTSLDDPLSAGTDGFTQDYIHDTSGFYGPHSSSPHQLHHQSVRRPSFVPTANAAAALAQLSNSRPESHWDAGRVRISMSALGQWINNLV